MDRPEIAKPCCTPARGARTANDAPPDPGRYAIRQVEPDAVTIPGGRALLGTKHAQIPEDGESPLKSSTVKPFLLGATCVTNAQFAKFVEATGYVTEAEQIGWSFVFLSQVPDSVGPTQRVREVDWWRRVDGANWRDINGPGTADKTCLPDHPVVQVSWRDAKAYAAWVGGRLPTEVEWEHAARGGLGDVKFPWGDADPDDRAFQPCNIWQGRFPDVNTGLDGFVTTAPAAHFQPNGYGLYNMAGNVWEWTSEPFVIKSLKKAARARYAKMKGFKLLKGGSFLCHRSYCYRYRIAARSGTSPDTATTHQGFRVAWDLSDKPGQALDPTS